MFTINFNIIDVVINDILFNINNKESMLTYEWALLIFKLFKDANND